MKRRIFVFLSIVLFLILGISGEIQAKEFWKVDSQLHQYLISAFKTAFKTPEEFKNTQAFHLLGYNANEINLIGKITPRTDQIKVTFERGGSSGFFKSLSVTGKNVNYYKLVIDSATFSFKNIKLDLDQLKAGKIVFDKLDRINIETNVSEKDILRVFELFAKAKKLKKLQVKLKKEKTRVSGWFYKGFLAVYFKIFGTPILEGKKKIFFNCKRMTLNGIPLPRNAIRSIFSRINPVFDASRTWLNLEIDEIVTSKGKVKSLGRIEPRKNEQIKKVF
jgi:hypothetical protein